MSEKVTLGEVIGKLVDAAKTSGEPAFHTLGGGLVLRVKWISGAGQMQITLEREKVMPSNTEMTVVDGEMRRLGWDEVREIGPDWTGYLCRRYIWFCKRENDELVPRP